MFTKEFVNELCYILSSIKFDELAKHVQGTCTCYEENEDGTEQRCDMCCIHEFELQGKSIIIDTHVEMNLAYSKEILVNIDGMDFVIVVGGDFVVYDETSPMMMLGEVKDYLSSL
jgi:hypothetical protein